MRMFIDNLSIARTLAAGSNDSQAFRVLDIDFLEVLEFRYYGKARDWTYWEVRPVPAKLLKQAYKDLA